MWKLKEEANGKTKEQNAIEMKKRLDLLPAVIKEINQYEVSINIGSYGASFYDVGLISSFQNKDEFWAYTKYPEHDEVLEFIQSIQEDEQIVDYVQDSIKGEQ
jgi:hypothetical protein